MAEQKVLLPAYKRTGACARCGAAVYAPELKGGWPLMSACDCAHGPDIASERMTGKLTRAASAAALEEEQAKAA